MREDLPAGSDVREVGLRRGQHVAAGVAGVRRGVALRIDDGGQPAGSIIGVSRGGAVVVHDGRQQPVGRVGPRRDGLPVTDGEFGEDIEEGADAGYAAVEIVVDVTRLGERAVALVAGRIADFAGGTFIDKVIGEIEAPRDDVAHGVDDPDATVEPIVRKGGLRGGRGVDPVAAREVAIGVIIENVHGAQAGARGADRAEGQAAFVVGVGDDIVGFRAADGLRQAMQREAAVGVIDELVGDDALLERVRRFMRDLGRAVEAVVLVGRGPVRLGLVEGAVRSAVLAVDADQIVVRIVEKGRANALAEGRALSLLGNGDGLVECVVDG